MLKYKSFEITQVSSSIEEILELFQDEIEGDVWCEISTSIGLSGVDLGVSDIGLCSFDSDGIAHTGSNRANGGVRLVINGNDDISDHIIDLSHADDIHDFIDILNDLYNIYGDLLRVDFNIIVFKNCDGGVPDEIVSNLNKRILSEFSDYLNRYTFDDDGEFEDPFLIKDDVVLSYKIG